MEYQPITTKDLPDWMDALLDGINGEQERMNGLIQEARETIFNIRTALPELALACGGLDIRESEIYTAVRQEWKRWGEHSVKKMGHCHSIPSIRS